MKDTLLVSALVIHQSQSYPFRFKDKRGK